MASPGTYKGVTINSGTDAEIASQIAGIDARSTTPQTATPITPGAIPVSTLQEPTPTPAKVTQPAPATGTAALQGSINATTDSFTQGLSDKTAAAEKGLTPARNELYKALLNRTGSSQATNDLYAQTVDPAQKELNDINQKILADQVATRHQIEDLQKNNPEGLFGTGLQQEIQKIQDEGTRRQADLAVIQLSKQGQYDSAKEIADRAVKALTEKQQNKIDALQFMYEENKDLFTKAEQRQFEVAQADRNRELANTEYRARARFDSIIKQNDPLYQAQLAKAYSDATSRSETLNGKPQTATQAQVQGYADRTNQADITISKLGSQFTGATSYLGQALPNPLKSGDRQVYEQAQRNFVNAVLRRESGAVISPSEFESAAKQYFPQPGDTEKVVAQKAANRQTVINNLYQQSNVSRAALPGQIIESEGKQYQIADDGVSLIEL